MEIHSSLLASSSLAAWTQALRTGAIMQPTRLTGIVFPMATSMSSRVIRDTDSGLMPATLHFSALFKSLPFGPKVAWKAWLGRIHRWELLVLSVRVPPCFRWESTDEHKSRAQSQMATVGADCEEGVGPAAAAAMSFSNPSTCSRTLTCWRILRFK